MQINPDHLPPPAPFTEDEWFDLFMSVGFCGGTIEDKAARDTAVRAAFAIQRMVGDEYINTILMPRLNALTKED